MQDHSTRGFDQRLTTTLECLASVPAVDARRIELRLTDKELICLSKDELMTKVAEIESAIKVALQMGLMVSCYRDSLCAAEIVVFSREGRTR